MATTTDLAALADPKALTTPQLVREYASTRFSAGYYRGIGLDRTKASRDRQSALVDELRARGILD